jgi:N-acetylmuramoyl-L-alanine amidase
VVRISISVFTVMHQEQVREVLWFVFPEVHVMLERRYLTVHAVLEAKAVNKKSHGTIRSDYYTTINWAKIPTMILECGFLTNPTEDRQLNSSSYQKKLAKGIANGVDKYFK